MWTKAVLYLLQKLLTYEFLSSFAVCQLTGGHSEVLRELTRNNMKGPWVPE